MKKIDNNFTRNGFSFALEKREGDIAMFKKTYTGKPDSSEWIEVVKLIEDEGQEVFPASTSYGFTAFTYKGEQKDEAETMFNEMVEEYNEAKDEVETPTTGDSPTPADEVTTAVVADAPVDNSSNVTTPDKQASTTPKARGRKRADIDFQIPKNGTFRAKDLADQYSVSVPFVHNRLNELIEQGKVKVVERVPGNRGKAQKIMEWVN